MAGLRVLRMQTSNATSKSNKKPIKLFASNGDHCKNMINLNPSIKTMIAKHCKTTGQHNMACRRQHHSQTDVLHGVPTHTTPCTHTSCTRPRTRHLVRHTTPHTHDTDGVVHTRRRRVRTACVHIMRAVVVRIICAQVCAKCVREMTLCACAPDMHTLCARQAHRHTACVQIIS